MASRIQRVNNHRPLLFFILAVCFIPSFCFFAGQAYYQRAETLTRQGEYVQAAQSLKTAGKWLPLNSRIQQKLGELHLAMSASVGGFFHNVLLTRSVEYLQKAEQLNPLEPEIAISLAHVLSIQGKETPDTIIAAYQRAIDLWPNNALYHQVLADKLYEFGRRDELRRTILTLGRIYPGSYYKTSRKAYWNDELQQAYTKGLYLAIDQKTDVRKAYFALAAMNAQQSDWPAAAENYRLALTLEQHSNKAREYFRLGNYYLQSQNVEDATHAFLQGMKMQQSAAKSLNNLLTRFKKTGNLDAFPPFYRQIKTKLGFSYLEDIQMAKILIKNNQLDFARQLLTQVIKERDYLPEPKTLLQQITEK